MSHNTPAWKTYGAIYIVLLVLLAVTVLAARFDLGRWNFAVALFIASAKATLIVWFFMHVRNGDPLVKLVVVIGIFWMVILFSLTLADYRTRGWDSQIDQPAEARSLPDISGAVPAA